MAATGVIATVAGYQQQGQVCFFYPLFIYSTNEYLHIDYVYEQQLTVTCFDNNGYQHDDDDEGQREDEKSDENAQETSCGMFFFPSSFFYFHITNFFFRYNALSFRQPPPVFMTMATVGSRHVCVSNLRSVFFCFSFYFLLY